MKPSRSNSISRLQLSLVSIMLPLGLSWNNYFHPGVVPYASTYEQAAISGASMAFPMLCLILWLALKGNKKSVGKKFIPNVAKINKSIAGEGKNEKVSSLGNHVALKQMQGFSQDFEVLKKQVQEQNNQIEILPQMIDDKILEAHRTQTQNTQLLVEQKIEKVMPSLKQINPVEGSDNLVAVQTIILKIFGVSHFQELAQFPLVHEFQLNEKQTALLSGKAVKTLRNERNERKGIIYHKDNKRVSYRLGDVLEYMEARRVELFN